MQNLTQLLTNPLFQPIIRKIQHIKQLNQALHEALPADLREHCRVAGIKETCLILQVNNGAWATQLRYATPQLLQALRAQSDFVNIESIRWQVQLQTDQCNTANSNHLTKLTQSETVKMLLITTSQGIKNQKLRISIERLAQSVSLTSRHGVTPSPQPSPAPTTCILKDFSKAREGFFGTDPCTTSK